MTKDEEKLIAHFRSMGKIATIIESATVVSVDTDNLTCVVELADETEIADVRLKAAIDEVKDGIVQIPVVGSTVLVGSIGNKVGVRAVIMVSEVEETLFDGGENGGLIRIAELVEKLNNLENKVNDIVSKFNSHVHTGVSTGGGSSGTTPTTVSGTLTTTQQSDLENEKVKH